MQKLHPDEIKKIELEILRHIDKFCKENGIEYFLNYGTLLGAIRHGGFIPWDDDLDISMTRENYEKFIKLYKEKNSSKYEILSYETDKNYFNTFIKIHDTDTHLVYTNLTKSYNSGIFVDIFPIDRFESKSIISISYFLDSLAYLTYNKKETIQYGDSKLKDLARRIMWHLVQPISPSIFPKLINKLIPFYKTDKPTYSIFIINKFKEENILPLNIGEELTEVSFEGEMFPAPKNYHEVLTARYGDYMTPPPEGQRITHEFEAYRK
ncbi:MAG: LicD family protein [Gemella sp.]|nr:LicD family protein [Gemella sp.]